MNRKRNPITILALALLMLTLASGPGLPTKHPVLARGLAEATTTDDNAWSALGAGVDGEVRAIAVSGNYVYVGGTFSSAGNCTTGCTNIARWNMTTHTWSALDTGVDGQVFAIAVSENNNVYVGGAFEHAGGWLASRIAVWHGSTGWSSLGAMNGSVYAIAVIEDYVYAGGEFTQAGTCTGPEGGCWFIARRHSYSGWSSLGTGTDSYVKALTVGNSGVYVGGDFLSASGLLYTSGIAYWSHSDWDSLDKGREGGVNAIAVSGGDVYVPGVVYSEGGVPETTLSKWNSRSGWSDLSPGLGDNNAIYAIAVSGSNVYAGGAFQDNDHGAPNHIARWNSASGWSSLGQGTDGTVYAIAVSGSDIYVGGSFAHAGGKVASGIAKYSAASFHVYLPLVLRFQ